MQLAVIRWAALALFRATLRKARRQTDESLGRARSPNPSWHRAIKATIDTHGVPNCVGPPDNHTNHRRTFCRLFAYDYALLISERS
jgi:hypothetical protein